MRNICSTVIGGGGGNCWGVSSCGGLLLLLGERIMMPKRVGVNWAFLKINNN
jgi:hypothetical protein